MTYYHSATRATVSAVLFVLAGICLSTMPVLAGCGGTVDSSHGDGGLIEPFENVGEAADAPSCGPRGAGPPGQAFDYSTSPRRPTCATSSQCPAYDGNPCTSGAPYCAHGFCYYPAAPDYTLCQGLSTDPIHGECIDGSCLIQEWTCFHNP